MSRRRFAMKPAPRSAGSLCVGFALGAVQMTTATASETETTLGDYTASLIPGADETGSYPLDFSADGTAAIVENFGAFSEYRYSSASFSYALTPPAGDFSTGIYLNADGSKIVGTINDVGSYNAVLFTAGSPSGTLLTVTDSLDTFGVAVSPSGNYVVAKIGVIFVGVAVFDGSGTLVIDERDLGLGVTGTGETAISVNDSGEVIIRNDAEVIAMDITGAVTSLFTIDDGAVYTVGSSGNDAFLVRNVDTFSAFRVYARDGSYTEVGLPSADYDRLDAYAMSKSGEYVAGDLRDLAGLFHTYIWTAETGIVIINAPLPDPETVEAYPIAISDAGAVACDQYDYAAGIDKAVVIEREVIEVETEAEESEAVAVNGLRLTIKL